MKHQLLAILAAIWLAACGSGDTDLSRFDGEAVGAPPALPSSAAKLVFVGSSTVSPFSTTVAEQFGAATRFRTPIVETTGTGGGFKLFCEGIGPDTPSISNASRTIKATEMSICRENGVTEIVEVPIGFDGIVLANATDAPVFSLTKAQIFQGLAARLPDENGELVDNPNKTWSDIDASLPDLEIKVFGPPPTSGTRDAFMEIAMELGAKEYVKEMGFEGELAEAVEKAGTLLRSDGAWIDAGENDASIIQTLIKNKGALGVLGFSFLEQNADRVKAAKVNGISPTFEAIASGEYKVSRSMYIYVKKANVGLVPGLVEFVDEFTSEGTWGPTGYLVEKGLIPLPEARRAEVRQKALSLETMQPKG